MTSPATYNFFNVLLEVQHPVQAHTKVLRSLLKHQAFVIDKHAQFPFSFSVIEMVGGRNCPTYCRRNCRRLSTRIVMSLLRPSQTSQQDGQVVSVAVLPKCCFRKISDINVKQHRRKNGTLRYTVLHSSEPTALSVAGVHYEAPV